MILDVLVNMPVGGPSADHIVEWVRRNTADPRGGMNAAIYFLHAALVTEMLTSGPFPLIDSREGLLPEAEAALWAAWSKRPKYTREMFDRFKAAVRRIVTDGWDAQRLDVSEWEKPAAPAGPGEVSVGG